MMVIWVTSHATPSLGSSSRRAVSHSPSGEGVTARCDALLSPSLHSHRHPARGHGPQSPCVSSVHPLSLQSRAVSDLPVKKGANFLARAPLGPGTQQKTSPHAAVAAALRHCSLQRRGGSHMNFVCVISSGLSSHL